MVFIVLAYLRFFPERRQYIRSVSYLEAVLIDERVLHARRHISRSVSIPVSHVGDHHATAVCGDVVGGRLLRLVNVGFHILGGGRPVGGVVAFF